MLLCGFMACLLCLLDFVTTSIVLIRFYGNIFCAYWILRQHLLCLLDFTTTSFVLIGFYNNIFCYYGALQLSSFICYNRCFKDHLSFPPELIKGKKHLIINLLISRKNALSKQRRIAIYVDIILFIYCLLILL